MTMASRDSLIRKEIEDLIEDKNFWKLQSQTKDTENEALMKKVRSLQRTILKARRELNLTFTLVLPKRGTVTHKGMRRTLELLGRKFKTKSI